MKFRRIFTPVILIMTLLVQFLPGTVFAPRPVAAVSCDAAQFMADVTIPDGTSFAPGAALVKTWRLKNIGTCTWSTSYAIVFHSGAKMDAPSVVNLPTSVAPGATVDVTVNMTAPAAAGHYRGNWMLRNASSVLFGVGPSGNWVFFVDIVVAASSTTAYDFVANSCSAVWTSGAGTLPCPGTDGDAKGFVLKLDVPKLEDGTNGPAGLLTFPQNITDGYIQGVYPAFTVQSGDHFLSIINCQYGATGCYVTFQLNYQVGSGPIQTLKTFKEKLDGMYYNLDVNLSSLAGQNVNFILKVLATGSPTGDRAVWAGARIARAGGAPPSPPSTCDAAQFMADVTIPDGTSFAPGAALVKTWRLKNIGTCTWSTSYAIVFHSGAKMDAPSVVNLPTSVAPGATVDVTVNMTAPAAAGHYRGNWMLRNASSVLFGVGPSGNWVFFVDIVVAASSTTAYDFVANSCSAVWTSGAGTLPCPGTDGDAKGFVLKLDVPKLEDGTNGPAGLLTFPQNITDGYIQGVYPAFTVQSGDHFLSIINCQYGATGCYVTFQLNYQVGSGPIQTLKTFKEKLDGMYYNLDVNLSSLAGQNVNFILKVLATGSPTGDRAVWAGARIARAGTNPPAPTMVNVYFLDSARYVANTPPFEIAVLRSASLSHSDPETVLTQLFLGPTPAEQTAGLRVILSGTTGYSSLAITSGIARVYLTGTCASGGATYTIANLIFKNLKQFPTIQWVKIYDQSSNTTTPDGNSDSIPVCLNP